MDDREEAASSKDEIETAEKVEQVGEISGMGANEWE